MYYILITLGVNFDTLTDMVRNYLAQQLTFSRREINIDIS